MIISGRTDTGRMRQNNEDAYYISDGPVGIFDSLVIVCDGMGGHSFGEVASATCVDSVVRYISRAPINNPITILENAIAKANLDVRKKSEELHSRGMGTTLVMCGMISGTCYIANIGDSRLYEINGPRFTMRQITKDHSLVEEQVERGLIERNSEEYFKQKNVITRAIGVYSEPDPDYFELEAKPEHYLLLCSDGLSNMVSDLVIKNLALDDTFDMERRVQSLVNVANNNGGKDNITVILVKFEGEQE